MKKNRSKGKRRVWKAKDLWEPGAKLSIGEGHKDKQAKRVPTRENPYIIWYSNPRKYEWKDMGLDPGQMRDYYNRHMAIAKQECLRWGWTYVVIRKELHKTTGKELDKRPCDPHITVFLSTTAGHYQVEGHWFCKENKEKPLYPDEIMPDWTVHRPLPIRSRPIRSRPIRPRPIRPRPIPSRPIPSRDLYLMGQPPFNLSLPEERTVPLPVSASSSSSTAASSVPATAPSPAPSTAASSVPATSPSPASVPPSPSPPVQTSPSSSGVKRKRSSDEVDPADPATNSPEINDADKRAKRRIEETGDHASQAQVSSQSAR